jgi:hypothetical protein
MPKRNNHIKDANAQLQAWTKDKVSPETQKSKVQGWLSSAQPFVVRWAEEIGGIYNLNDKTKALNEFFKTSVTALDADDRASFREKLCDALQIKAAEWRERIAPIREKEIEEKRKAKKASGKDEDAIISTGGWLFDHFLGLEYDPSEDRTFLAVRYPDGHVEDRVEKLEIDKRIYIPQPPNNIIRKRILLLPSQMTELKSEEELLFATRAHNYKYFDCGSDETLEHLLMIYPLYSYMASQFRTVPYLRALGDYGTGKTRMLETIGPLCFQAIMTNAGSSASALFRILDLYQNSTLVLDEADFKDSSEASMIGKILNGGNRKGTAILKSEKNAMGNFDAEGYTVFGPKIIGMRKDFDDAATTSRCITKEMLPIQPHPRISPELPPLQIYENACLKIRNALFTYMMHNLQRDCDVSFEGMDSAIDERTKQITVSLLTVMKSEKGKEMVMEYMRLVTEERKGDRYEMFTARVLEGIILAWAWGPVSDREEDGGRVYLKDVSAATNMVVDEQNRRMGEMDDDDDKDGKNKKMKSRKLTTIFKNYLNIKTLRATDGTPEYKGTKFINLADPDMLMRVKGLCERWGVEWRDSGSLGDMHTFSEEEVWMKKQAMIELNTGSNGSNGFKSERKAWYGSENGSRGANSEGE